MMHLMHRMASQSLDSGDGAIGSSSSTPVDVSTRGTPIRDTEEPVTPHGHRDTTATHSDYDGTAPTLHAPRASPAAGVQHMSSKPPAEVQTPAGPAPTFTLTRGAGTAIDEAVAPWRMRRNCQPRESPAPFGQLGRVLGEANASAREGTPRL